MVVSSQIDSVGSGVATEKGACCRVTFCCNEGHLPVSSTVKVTLTDVKETAPVVALSSELFS